MYNEKLKNLILFVLSSEDYKDEGIKKFNKILYFIDFYFYRDHEKLISDVKYAKAGRGPIIDNYKEIFSELVNDGVLSRKKDDLGPIFHSPKIKADIKVFSPEEIEHIHNVLKKYGRLSSAELESISHDQQPWVLTEKDGDIIDPDLALLIESEDDGNEAEVVSPKLKDELIKLANYFCAKRTNHHLVKNLQSR
jgi:uncharacterized phage-associated protein